MQPFISSGQPQVPFPSGSKIAGLKSGFSHLLGKIRQPIRESRRPILPPGKNWPADAGEPRIPSAGRRTKKGNRPVPDRLERRGRFFAFRPSLLPATAVSSPKGRPLIRHSL